MFELLPTKLIVKWNPRNVYFTSFPESSVSTRVCHSTRLRSEKCMRLFCMSQNYCIQVSNMHSIPSVYWKKHYLSVKSKITNQKDRCNSLTRRKNGVSSLAKFVVAIRMVAYFGFIFLPNYGLAKSRWKSNASIIWYFRKLLVLIFIVLESSGNTVER